MERKPKKLEFDCHRQNKMSAIEMVCFCETADDWIAMICNQCKIRRPSKASYWFNVCEAVFDSMKSRPLRNCDKYRTLEEAHIAWGLLRLSEMGKHGYSFEKWLYDEANE